MTVVSAVYPGGVVIAEEVDDDVLPVLVLDHAIAGATLIEVDYEAVVQ